MWQINQPLSADFSAEDSSRGPRPISALGSYCSEWEGECLLAFWDHRRILGSQTRYVFCDMAKGTLIPSFIEPAAEFLSTIVGPLRAGAPHGSGKLCLACMPVPILPGPAIWSFKVALVGLSAHPLSQSCSLLSRVVVFVLCRPVSHLPGPFKTSSLWAQIVHPEGREGLPVSLSLL